MPKHVMAKKSLQWHFETRPLTFWRGKHTAYWFGSKDGGVTTRGGKVGLARRLQFSDSFSTAWKLGVIILLPFFTDRRENTSNGLELGKSNFHLSLMSTCQGLLKSVVPAQNGDFSLTEGPNVTHISWKEIGATVMVYCVSERCPNDPLPLPALLFITGVNSTFWKNVFILRCFLSCGVSSPLQVNDFFCLLTFELGITVLQSLKRKAKNSCLSTW